MAQIPNQFLTEIFAQKNLKTVKNFWIFLRLGLNIGVKSNNKHFQTLPTRVLLEIRSKAMERETPIGYTSEHMKCAFNSKGICVRNM